MCWFFCLFFLRSGSILVVWFRVVSGLCVKGWYLVGSDFMEEDLILEFEELVWKVIKKKFGMYVVGLLLDRFIL